MASRGANMIWLIVYVIGAFIYMFSMGALLQELYPKNKAIELTLKSCFGWPVILLVLVFYKLFKWLIN
jgi:hypothetical protein